MSFPRRAPTGLPPPAPQTEDQPAPSTISVSLKYGSSMDATSLPALSRVRSFEVSTASILKATFPGFLPPYYEPLPHQVVLHYIEHPSYEMGGMPIRADSAIIVGNLRKAVTRYLRGSVSKLDVEKYLCRTV